MASFSRTLSVDLGATAVRIVDLGPDGKGRPVIHGISLAEVAYDPAKTSDFFPLYAEAIGNALRQLPGKTRNCRLSLGGPAVFSRILKLPVSDASKVASMIGFEAQQAVPAIEQALWDYQLLPSTQTGELEALILAMKKDTVQELSAAASSAGLKVEGVTLAPVALLNSFFFNYPQVEGSSLILEIGARATTVLLVEGGRVFIRIVPLGGGAVTQAVATDMQESFAGAELLKKAEGFVHPGGAYEDPPNPNAARISKLARGVMTRLHAEVERSITFFRSQQGGGKPQQAWIAGGGVAMGYTDLFFREKLRIPVEFFQPFRRIGFVSGANPQVVARDFPAWAAAVGGGLQCLADPPFRINLAAAKEGQASASGSPAAVAVLAIFGGLLLFLPGLHGFWQAQRAQKTLEDKTQMVAEAEGALQKLEAENKNFQLAVQREEEAAKLEAERLRWLGLLAELKRCSPPRLWITGLKVSQATAETDKPVSAQAAPAVPMVEITGMFETLSATTDFQPVEKFKSALSEGGLLRNVSVLERETRKIVDGKTDQVALKFRMKAEWPMTDPANSAPPARPPAP